VVHSNRIRQQDEEAKIMKRIACHLFLSLLFFFHTAKSTTWISIQNGSWSDASIWSLGIAPSYSTSDTILIKDTIAFDDDIYLNAGALMQIDSNGGALCGHHDISVFSGAKLNKYGALNIDTLYIKGGIGKIITPEPFLIWLMIISDGGSLYMHSYMESCICTWDTCFIPIPMVVPPVNPGLEISYTLFPNPSNGNFNLQYSQEKASTFYFYDALGQLIFSRILEGTSGNKNFMQNHLSNGMYYWKVLSGDKVHQKGKQFIIK